MNKINLANLPTPIEKIESLSKKYKKNIYIKRDDFTGTEVSGNKIRKLEYTMQDAINQCADTIITTGAIQSNHCRATAAASAKLGLDCHLVLVGEVGNNEGNYFLDKLLGAKIHVIKESSERETYVEELIQNLNDNGHKAYYMPVGASTSVGALGYQACFDEIIDQEKSLGVKFDAIFSTTGSGGTYAGLWYGNYKNKSNKEIFGISVSESSEHFKKVIVEILKGMNCNITDFNGINIVDDYIGLGYGKYTEKEIQAYIDISKETGIIFDPCYTGKGFIGMLEEIKNSDFENILFIHTGGLQGWTKEMRDVADKLLNY
ncbi:D-cysteine desulfhydrase family protein [Peptoniphilus indolicus]|uniref:D-cysteine desulfhydrase n=2 Tax=Peptoniphilus indolicus TaxID=33030 RepID=G4D3E3_9FIRM|nr:D-cysteine desulfhydrase family protein [Peptoniphilus indolicus]EGY79963.1 D-cysteine desulfhydrase [Peptoniphilus indolicus ATCC 29427]SUB74994.1 D-cysteine desulfhydrase [Peptoniphilus indolicus]SUB94771.1 D-cysteine desulfhydrase [Peptoniphilus indolicus]